MSVFIVVTVAGTLRGGAAVSAEGFEQPALHWQTTMT